MKELWGDLSEAEQKAAKDLGFDAEIWEEGGTPSRCWLPFSELKDFEQKAANLLGYASGRASDPQGASYTRAAPTALLTPRLLLPLQVHAADLGRRELLPREHREPDGRDRRRGDRQAHVRSRRRRTRSASGREPAAPERLAAKDRNWADMKEKERHAAESLGFTADGWDGGDTPYAFTLPWRRISMRAKAAAQYLGYKPEGWDKEAYNTAQARLVIAKAETAAMLRHDGTPPPGKEGAGPRTARTRIGGTSCSRGRQAARVLGYTQEAWDEGEAPQGEVGRAHAAAPRTPRSGCDVGVLGLGGRADALVRGDRRAGPLRNRGRPLGGLQDDGPPLVHPRRTTKREDVMRRIDEPPRAAEGGAGSRIAGDPQLEAALGAGVEAEPRRQGARGAEALRRRLASLTRRWRRRTGGGGEPFAATGLPPRLAESSSSVPTSTRRSLSR